MCNTYAPYKMYIDICHTLIYIIAGSSLKMSNSIKHILITKRIENKYNGNKKNDLVNQDIALCHHK